MISHGDKFHKSSSNMGRGLCIEYEKVDIQRRTMSHCLEKRSFETSTTRNSRF